ncbi:MAG: glycosyltransferase family 4 protein [Bacteroidota bacterium]
MKKLIYIKPTNSPFIVKDEEILQSEYDVQSFLIGQNKSKIKYFFRLGSLFFYLLFRTGKAKIFVTWFGDYHAAVMVLAARILGKKSVFFAGGQEAICYPELGKGVYLKKFRGNCVRYALRKTTLIIPNHESLLYHENNYYQAGTPKIDGIKHYVKNFKTPYVVIPNGIDAKKFRREESIPKDNKMVLTVGTMNQKNDFINKGFDLFVEAARLNTHLHFVLISVKSQFMPWVEEVYKVSTIPNLTIIPYFCPDEKLAEYYNRAKVFVQASITEGMPNTLGEAMLMGCIPVGSNVNGIPDVIGNTGIVIKTRDVNELSDAILKAIEMDTSEQCRKRIMMKFSFGQRQEKVIEAMQSL